MEKRPGNPRSVTVDDVDQWLKATEQKQAALVSEVDDVLVKPGQRRLRGFLAKIAEPEPLSMRVQDAAEALRQSRKVTLIGINEYVRKRMEPVYGAYVLRKRAAQMVGDTASEGTPSRKSLSLKQRLGQWFTNNVAAPHPEDTPQQP